MLVVPILLYGAVLAFQTYSYATGGTFPFLRFYIVAIPFAASLRCWPFPMVRRDTQAAGKVRAGAATVSNPAGADLLCDGCAGFRDRHSGNCVGDEPAQLRATGVRAGGSAASRPVRHQRAERGRAEDRRHLLHRAGGRAIWTVWICRTAR